MGIFEVEFAPIVREPRYAVVPASSSDYQMNRSPTWIVRGKLPWRVIAPKLELP